MKLLSAIGGGFAGAITLTLIHETVRRSIFDAPRMDLLGMEAIAKTLDSVEAEVPEEDKLFKITMAGDIVSNALYYSLTGIGKGEQAVLRGAFLGLAAGIGAVYLPKPLGLNAAPAGRTTQTKVMTFALYTIGGVVAGFIGKLLENKQPVL